MKQTPIWERQPDETAKAYAAFIVYRDLDEQRSLDKAARKHNKSISTLAPWSARYNWVERADAYDRYIRARAQAVIEQEQIDRRVEMLKRHAQIGRVLQKQGVEYLTQVGIDRSSDAISAVNKGVELERKSEGLPDYLLEVQTLSDDELAARYAGLIAALGGNEAGDAEAWDIDPDAEGDGDSA